MEELQFITRARLHGRTNAYLTDDCLVSYDALLARSEELASTILSGAKDLESARIAFLVPPGATYTVAQWGIWRAGGVCVPLCLAATPKEWVYALSDSEASMVLVSGELAESMRPLAERLNLRLVDLGAIAPPVKVALPHLTPDRPAMILYTSGTTSLPKGVVSTHANIQAQIEALVAAWRWEASDRIPLFLPLHHIHGIINVVACALWVGARIESYPRFDIERLLPRVAADAFTVFMAVPTIYVKLIQALEAMGEEERACVTKGFAQMRLMVSGSAALPASVHERWTELTGQRLLERYGMTEIGMALSNLYQGERRPGSVGVPLPQVDVRLKSEAGELVVGEDQPGEIQVQGPAVFHSYWRRENVTEESFDDGWFRTGDVAVRERGYYRIMGRLSVDIIKSGGYKLSALEIESVLLEHPRIRECAVIGVQDDVWGEAVAAALVLRDSGNMGLAELREWCRDKMSVYKIPQRLVVLEALPRNAMGKVTKPALRSAFDDGN